MAEQPVLEIREAGGARGNLHGPPTTTSDNFLGDALLTILGNSAVLAVAIRRSSRLRSPELLTVNLAVTDLGMAISMYPLAIASAWNHAWLGGDAACIYYALMGFFFGVSSMMTLCVMAVIRFFVTHSAKSNSHNINRNVIRVSITLIWLYAALWAILPLLGWGHYGPEPFGTSCTIAWGQFHNSFSGFSFILSMFILCTFLPAMTIIICYLSIAWKIHKTYQEIQNFNRISNAGKLEKKLTLMAVLVSVGFLGAWTPYAAVSFWSIFHSSETIPYFVTLLPCLFAKSSTAYNPFIYYTFSKTFRREVKQLHCCHAQQVHFFNTKNSIDKHVSVMWSGRGNVHISSIRKIESGEIQNQ
ncbi:opsin-5-like isoform X2 [Hemicordylus capensis]|uniref:opsin-5-like isoform X2 n=1 Tax=Hemicordylus capensis TaxID=884348 RepID=UPI00230297F1|nr:opsin-5-like isoform X2 [Hemicordylus capensis]